MSNAERIMFTTTMHVDRYLQVEHGDLGWRYEQLANTNIPYYRVIADKKPERSFNTHSDNFLIMT
jgi:hypothetical protein